MDAEPAACLDEGAILALLDGTLPPDALGDVEAHVARCQDCRALVSELARASLPLVAGGETYSAGLVLGGRFRLLRLLGTGGTGAVWAALHLVTRREVALKLAKGIVGEREQRRFLREARIAGALDHPGIVPIRDAFELDDGTPVLVMELLHGQSLREHLRDRVRLSPADFLVLLAPLLDALEAAHAAGVTHRDLKPENIFLVEEGGTTLVRVLDFGIAKLTTADELSGESTQTGEILGTPFYMAPEQAFGETIDARADVWALGVLVYECLAGERPFSGENLGQVLKAVTTGRYRPLRTVQPEVPAYLGALVDRMLVVDQSRRLAGIAEVRAALVPRPRRGLFIAGAALAATTAAAAAGIVWKMSHPATPHAAPMVPVVSAPAERSRVAEPKPEGPAPHVVPHHARPAAAVTGPAPAPAAAPASRLPGGVVGESPF